MSDELSEQNTVLLNTITDYFRTVTPDVVPESDPLPIFLMRRPGHRPLLVPYIGNLDGGFSRSPDIQRLLWTTMHDYRPTSVAFGHFAWTTTVEPSDDKRLDPRRFAGRLGEHPRRIEALVITAADHDTQQQCLATYNVSRSNGVPIIGDQDTLMIDNGPPDTIRGVVIAYFLEALHDIHGARSK